jgi:hypothetical protein
MTIGQIKSNITNALLRNIDIFDPSSKYLLRKNDQIPFNEDVLFGYTFYAPKQLNRDAVDGIKLKDGKGYISISETYKQVNLHDYIKIAHVYRYITNEYTYECKSSGLNSKIIPYNFHYDMDLEFDTPQHPLVHLQVLHSVPRFPVKEKSLEEFLERVKVTCFDEELSPLVEPIYLT